MDTVRTASTGPPVTVKKAVRTFSVQAKNRNWRYLVVDWAVIAASIGVHIAVGGVLVYVVVCILIGSRLRALANLLHESAHYKLFPDRRANRIAGMMLCAWPTVTSYRRYVTLHRMHHSYLWNSEQDPDAALYRITRTQVGSVHRMPYRRFAAQHLLLAVIPVLPLWRLWCERRRDVQGLVVRLSAACGMAALVLFEPGMATFPLLYWFIPWLTSYQILRYWAELGEHGGLRSFGHDWGSRNWRGNAVTRWLIGSHSDDLYHLLHHWFPSVPHYRLRELDSICRLFWPEYDSHVRCTGFFVGSARGVSVLRDMWLGGVDRLA
jgi:fatty acid desaturase